MQKIRKIIYEIITTILKIMLILIFFVAALFIGFSWFHQQAMKNSISGGATEVYNSGD